MAVRTYSELEGLIKELLKDNTSDEAISLLEDLEDSASTIGTGKKYQYDEDMEAKIKETDDNWRAKYIARFYNPEPVEHDSVAVRAAEDTPPAEETIKVKDLFKEVG